MFAIRRLIARPRNNNSNILLRHQYTSPATATNAQQTVTAEAVTESVSSCPEGTVMTGLNIYKNGKDPVAMADSAYPSWLWNLLEPRTDSPVKAIRDARNRHIKEVNSRKRKS